MRHTTSRAHRLIASAAVAGALLVAAGCSGDELAEPVAEAASDAVDAVDAVDTGDTDGTTSTPDYGLVTPAQAAALAASGVTVIDVRTPDEYAEGHIEGARLINLASGTFGEEVAALDRDDEYLVYCRSDNRSGQAVALMEELGFDRLWDLDGGTVAYTAAGFPLVN